jgi:dihydrofolate reductase
LALLGALLGLGAWHRLLPWAEQLVDGTAAAGALVPLAVTVLIGGAWMLATLRPAERATRIDPAAVREVDGQPAAPGSRSCWNSGESARRTGEGGGRRMRRIRYQVACSLDGFIAGPDDDFGWITPEPAFDFAAHYAQFETLLMGRRTYEVVRGAGQDFGGKEVLVASRTLRPEDNPGVEVVAAGLEQRIRALRGGPGGDIWLYGGGDLFGQLLAWDLVDTVEPAIMPILLGGGVPFLPSPAARRRLTLARHRVYPSGMVLLEYEVR